MTGIEASPATQVIAALIAAARNGGTFQPRLGPTVRPHQYLCERPDDAGCRK